MSSTTGRSGRISAPPDLTLALDDPRQENAPGFFIAHITKGESPWAGKSPSRKWPTSTSCPPAPSGRYIADGRLTAYRVGPRMIRLDADQVRRQLDGDPIATTDGVA
jgi:hypothetical protein